MQLFGFTTFSCIFLEKFRATPTPGAAYFLRMDVRAGDKFPYRLIGGTGLKPGYSLYPPDRQRTTRSVSIVLRLKRHPADVSPLQPDFRQRIAAVYEKPAFGLQHSPDIPEACFFYFRVSAIQRAYAHSKSQVEKPG